MKDNEMKHIKALLKIYIRTNQPVNWKYIERKSMEYKIDNDLVKILYAEVNCGL